MNLQKKIFYRRECNCDKSVIDDERTKNKPLHGKIIKEKTFEDKKASELNSFPKIVKLKDKSGKLNLKNILIYPPDGEKGPPLVLYKKFSNIDCMIKGDATEGFRYKVTYKQKFINPIWHPKENSGRPFQKKGNCRNSTDYG